MRIVPYGMVTSLSSLLLLGGVPPELPIRIDVAGSPAPLFDDPIFHGASDPFVIWVAPKKAWYMYYTQRRASMTGAKGVDWVHGSAIGIAASADGKTWTYLGTAKGNHGLTDPLKEKGNGPDEGITWWAPCFLELNGTYHMWVSRVDGVYNNWGGKASIVHFTSADGESWTYADTVPTPSERVIDPTVYKVGDTWHMVYKDERRGSHTQTCESPDLGVWTNFHTAQDKYSEEAPFAFRWKDKWWMLTDGTGKQGGVLRVYNSENGVDGWTLNATILGGDSEGRRPQDSGSGHHPGIVLQPGPNATEQCVLFYFTHQRNRTVIQIAELEVGPDGKAFCDRNKHAPATRPTTP